MAGTPDALSTCNSLQDSQAWDFSALPQLKYAGRCADLSGGFLSNGRGKLIMYGCTGGANQKWYGLSLNDNPLLPLVANRHAALLLDYSASRGATP